MTKISTIRVRTGDGIFHPRKLVVDGRVIEGARVQSLYEDELPRLVVYRPSADVQEVSGLAITELGKFFSSVAVLIEPSISDFFGRVELSWQEPTTERITDRPPPGVTFWATARLNEWAKPYSAAELSEAMRIELANHPELESVFFQAGTGIPRGTPDFAVTFPFDLHCTTISDLVNLYRPTLSQLFEESVQVLLKSARRDALVTFFEFPKNVRTACEQYLLYFVQFLADLGIDADAELKEDAHRILFSVTPKDGGEALERIQEALQAFLSLPESGAMRDYASSVPDIAHQQLAANVMHLESQLALARAIDEARSATIENLQIANFQYRQMLLAAQNPELPASGLSDDASTSGQTDREEFLDGTVAVTPYKGKGIEVNLPKIIRRLKRRFT